ncbi:MAG: galactokinase [Chloroflexi bacterium]|nr:galactokinase [Chloroflexota bacterium]
MPLLETLLHAFRAAFHAGPAFVVRAPGRVNLLGEHVDYNDGWVLPVAVDRAAYLAVGPCVSRLVSLSAPDMRGGVTFRTAELDSRVDVAGRPLPSWARYPAGVAWALQQGGLPVSGMDAVLMADVPRGAGLSSSAAVEVAFAVAWQELGGWTLPPMELARACQRAEGEYVGVKGGLMDQFASLHGRRGHALLLDCRTLRWEAVPLPPDVAIVVANTNVRRTLVNSAYNQRREQCEQAVRLLREKLPGIHALRDVSPTEFNRHAEALPEVVRKRARHVVEECARTWAAVEHLKRGDVAAFGQAMNEGHASLRDLYEVSIPALDTMAEIARELPGCYGARLTGAGFGGCTVNLVARAAVTAFTRNLAARYAKATGIAPEIYACEAAERAGVLPRYSRLAAPVLEYNPGQIRSGGTNDDPNT